VPVEDGPKEPVEWELVSAGRPPPAGWKAYVGLRSGELATGVWAAELPDVDLGVKVDPPRPAAEDGLSTAGELGWWPRSDVGESTVGV